jgi:hypothetical protein
MAEYKPAAKALQDYYQCRQTENLLGNSDTAGTKCTIESDQRVLAPPEAVYLDLGKVAGAEAVLFVGRSHAQRRR